MIIAWTAFILLSLVASLSLFGLILSFFYDTAKESANFFWISVIFVFFASLPAQYIFGG